MKFIVTFALNPDHQDEAIARFKATGGQPPKGVTLLGRWTAVDMTGGFVLAESNDPSAMAEFTLMWSDLITLKTVPVIEDAALVEVFGRAGK